MLEALIQSAVLEHAFRIAEELGHNGYDAVAHLGVDGLIRRAEALLHSGFPDAAQMPSAEHWEVALLVVLSGIAFYRKELSANRIYSSAPHSHACGQQQQMLSTAAARVKLNVLLARLDRMKGSVTPLVRKLLALHEVDVDDAQVRPFRTQQNLVATQH